MIIGKNRMVFIAILFGLFIANVVPAKFRVLSLDSKNFSLQTSNSRLLT
jgi:acyl-CoA synthetase (AMP-forming)/AMP-acid ligase II